MKALLIISERQDLLAILQDRLASVRVQGGASSVHGYPSYWDLNLLMRRTRARTVLIDLAEPEIAFGLIDALHKKHPDVVVLAVHTQNSPDLILSAIRAGAAEYIGPPFAPETFERALLKQSSQQPQPRGRVIAFLPAIGGSGASTAAVHVAAHLARHSQGETVLIDLDFHSSSLNLRTRLQPRFTLAEAIERIECVDELWDQLTTTWDDIKIVTAPPTEAASNLAHAHMPAVFDSASQRYPWVIADLPAALFSSCQDVVRCCDAVYVVCTTELASLHHARRKAQHLAGLGLRPDMMRLLINRMGSDLTPAEIEQIVEMPVDFALRNDYQGVNTAYLKGRLVAENSILGRQFRDLAQRILGVQQQAPAPRPAGSRWKRALDAPRALVASCPTI